MSYKLPKIVKWAPSIFLAGALSYSLISGFKEGLSRAYEKPNLETKVVQEAEINDVNSNLNHNLSEANYPLIKSNAETKVNSRHLNEESIEYLAKTLYGEARGEIANGKDDYVRGSASSVITRADLKNKTIKETVLEKRFKKTKTGKIPVYQYTCFSEKDINYKEAMNPSDSNLYGLCREIAKKSIEEPNRLKVTNYYVGKPAVPKKYKDIADIRKQGIPSWA